MTADTLNLSNLFIRLPACVQARRRWLLPVALAVLNAVFWTVFAVAGGNLNVHGDSYEAYVWGQEYQLGYYKHPPFWAWLAGGWFSVFPHKDWAFFLLPELNASLGLVGIWSLLGRFTKSAERLAGVLLLLLTSFYTFNALRFNANTIQLSLWPWAMYFFVRSIELRTVKSGVVFGLLAGCTLLSKYYGGLLLLSCFVASLAHDSRTKYYRSPAPWAAVLTCLLVVVPHILWLVQNNFQPFMYARAQVAHAGNDEASFFLNFVLYLLLPAAVVLYYKATQMSRHEALAVEAMPHNKLFLTLLGLMPLTLTLLIALMGYKVMPHYILPAFSLIPFLVFCWFRLDAHKVTRGCLWIYGGILVLTLCVAPFVPGLVKRPFKALEPLAEAAIEVWKETTPAPLRFVSGSQLYAESLAFYAPSHVSELSLFTFAYSPWMTPELLKSEGLLIVCPTKEESCLQQAKAFTTSASRTVIKELTPRWCIHTKPRVSYTIIAVPPER